MSTGLLYAEDDVIAAKAMSPQHIPCDVATSEVMQKSQCGNACCCLKNWEVIKTVTTLI